MIATYDSTQDTLFHIRRVQQLLMLISTEFTRRGISHDASKLLSPEKEAFDEWTPKLAGMTYGSDEYKAALAQLKPALDHHYAANSHHPEHFGSGVNDMTLLDIVEMFCDWKAATERHNDGSLERSIKINATRFQLTQQLASIFENTRKEMGW